MLAKPADRGIVRVRCAIAERLRRCRRRSIVRLTIGVIAVVVIGLLPEVIYEIERTGPLPDHDEVWLHIMVRLSLVCIALWQLVSAGVAWLRRRYYSGLRKLVVAAVAIVLFVANDRTLVGLQYAQLHLLSGRYGECENVAANNIVRFATCERRQIGDVSVFIVSDKDAQLLMRSPAFDAFLANARNGQSPCLSECTLWVVPLARGFYFVAAAPR